MKDSRIRLKFWGVRGSTPTPVLENLGFGGNTTCIEVRSAEEILIIDGGSGARQLGIDLQQEFGGAGRTVRFLLTHFHWDHIQGLPFFAPLYSPQNQVIFHACRPPAQIEEVLEGQMSSPYFPAHFRFLSAKRQFSGGTGSMKHGDLTVYPFELHHPQGAWGYRIEKDGAAVTHASDFEHGDPHFDRLIREYSQNADVLIFDAQYTPEEYESKQGWGHSTWLEATRIARECNVKQLVLFHHDPGHNDHEMSCIVTQACAHFENTAAATEGHEICI